MSIKNLNILVSGSGIAGSAFAYWALRAYPNARVTIVERDPALRLTGASVDIRNAGVDIIKKMGVEQTIRDNCTEEKGMSFVTASGYPAATILATGRTDVQSFTSEYEIFRGSLAKILTKLIEPKVKLVFNETVESYTQEDDGVTVTFTKSKAVERFDLLVAADGTGSKIRAMMIDSTAPLQRLWETGMPTAYFTVKKDLLDGSKVAKWYTATGGRNINPKVKEDLVAAVKSGNKDSVMTKFEDLFDDAGWLSKEIMEGMRGSDDFYSSMFGHIRTPTLQDRRVVLLGDAGYAIPGIGTSLAIIGGYVLAGELLRNEGRVKDALKGYEDIMLPAIESRGGDDTNDSMQWVSPQSWFGIAIRNIFLGTVTRLRLHTLGISLFAMMGWKDDTIKMPDYEWPDEISEVGKKDPESVKV